MVELVILAIGVAIFLGFLGNVLFEKTGIPNTLWLLLFGAALGLLRVLPPDFVFSAAGIVGAIAIIGILSDGGLHLDLRKVLTEGASGFLWMLCGLLFSILVTLGVLSLAGFSFESALFTGIIIAGTSASVAVPILASMSGVSEKLRTVLSVESVFDTFSIVIAIIFVDVVSKRSEVSAGFFQLPLLQFFSAVAIGLLFGLAWSVVIARLKKFEFSYTATLGAFFLLYSLAELSGSSGALAVFFAGVMLANAYLVFGALFPKRKLLPLDDDLSKTHSLFAFLIRVFFFVFLGIIVGIPEPVYLFIGLAITMLIIAARFLYLPVFLWARLLEANRKEKILASIMVPRGLSAAVLSVFALSSGLPMASQIVQTVFSVILFSILATTLGVFFLRDRQKKEPEKKPLAFQELKLASFE
ncbi:MAG: cation:proton antiporter [Candidatus Diapherotrites archaeon]|nr:cation:proton antiporter [Candidatus Diapherotrites archaeon]